MQADARSALVPQATTPLSPRKRRRAGQRSPLELADIPAPKPHSRKVTPVQTPTRNRKPYIYLAGLGGSAIAIAAVFAVAGLDVMSPRPAATSPVTMAEISLQRVSTAQSEAVVANLTTIASAFASAAPDQLAAASAADTPPSRIARIARPQIPQAPVSLGAPDMISAPVLPTAISSVTQATSAQVPTPGERPTAFDCVQCSPALALYDGKQIDIFGGSAGDIQMLGRLASVAQTAPAMAIPAVQTQIRFFHPEDAVIATDLARRLNGRAVDLTWVSTTRPPDQLEVWFAAPPDPN